LEPYGAVRKCCSLHVLFWSASECGCGMVLKSLRLYINLQN